MFRSSNLRPDPVSRGGPRSASSRPVPAVARRLRGLLHGARRRRRGAEADEIAAGTLMLQPRGGGAAMPGGPARHPLRSPRQRPDRPHPRRPGLPQRRHAMGGRDLSLSAARGGRGRFAEDGGRPAGHRRRDQAPRRSRRNLRARQGRGPEGRAWSSSSGRTCSPTGSPTSRPGETVLIEIEYQAPVTVRGGDYSLRLPLVVGPRYVPPHTRDQRRGRRRRAGGHRALARSAPDARRSTRCRSRSISSPASRSPTSPAPITAIRAEAGPNGGRIIRLADGEVPADRDFELQLALGRRRRDGRPVPRAASATRII